MSFFIDLIQNIQLKLFKSSKEYKKRNLPLDMAEVITNASKVLICLPEGQPDAEMATGIVEKISSNFPAWAITLATNSDNLSFLTKKSKYSVVSYSAEDLSKSRKPKTAFLENSLKESFDIAIDMSIPFSFTNLVIIWQSGARLRVGFHHENREALYNFLLRHKTEASFETSYLSLVNYLQSFH